MTAKPRGKTSKKTTAVHLLLMAALAAEIAGGGFWLSRSARQTVSEYDTASAVQISPPVSAERCVASQPLVWLAGQVLTIGVRASDMSADAGLFSRLNIGGAVLMTAPADPSDGSIIKFKRAGASRAAPLLVSTDEEGGSVQRFQALGQLPAAQAAVANTPDEAHQNIYNHGLKLKTAGIDMVLGPLADVAPQQGASPLGDRIFSSDPSVVKSYDKAYVSGWQAAGVVPTLKHFPGLGSATANTDYQTATTPPLDQLKIRDLLPYQGMAATGTAVMIGNQNVPGWFMGPASLSPAANQYLRGALGYRNNLIITDSLSVPGVTSMTPESTAAAEAIEAGNDMAMLVEPVDNPTPAETVVIAAEQAIEAGVSSGKLPKRQLIEAVLRKLSAQHIAACSIGDRQSS